MLRAAHLAPLQVEDFVVQICGKRLYDLDSRCATRLEKPAILGIGKRFSIGRAEFHAVPTMIVPGSVVVIGGANGVKSSFLIQINRMERRSIDHAILDEAVFDQKINSDDYYEECVDGSKQGG